MVKLTINGQQVSVPEGMTIMEAAEKVGVHIPHLCYLKDINEIGACRVCLVELKGMEKLVTACNTICEEGMEILTNSPRVRRTRRINVELILSDHNINCASCIKSGNCTLQTIANDVGIIVSDYQNTAEMGRWDRNLPLVRDASKCVKCMRCIQVCEKVQGMGVWTLIGSGYRTTIGLKDNQPFSESDCALCGQCTVVCPKGIDMAQVCKSARENMVSTDKMPLAPHEFALMDMLFSNGEAFLCRRQPGYDKCRYVFFPGCQSSAIAPATVRAAYEDLCARLEGGVALMLGCCGAICDWAGRYEMYGQQFEFIENELAKLGYPTVIAACPSCKKELSGHENIEIVGIWDVLQEIGLPKEAKILERCAALHDSCGARGDAETQRSVRDILKKLGVSILETEYSGDRSGGLTSYTNRELAHELAEKCLERSDAPYVSYCMACRDRFAREGRESRHILELVYGTDAGAPPDISEKRYNRLTLKKELLRDIWGEETMNMDLPYKLEFDEAALKMMDERMILKSDVISVIDAYRESGEAIEDADTGYLMLRARLGNVTFWVALTEDEEGYTVRRAYSHRMNVVKRQE